MKSTHDHAAPARFPMLQGVLPITAAQSLAEVVAGITLAAIATPEVMGYTKISGTPVITGLYTIIRVQISYLSSFPTLKTLGCTRL